MKVKPILIIGIILVAVSLLYINAVGLTWMIPNDTFGSDPSEVTMIGQMTEPINFTFDITNIGESDPNVYYKIYYQQGEIWTQKVSGNQIVPEGQTRSFTLPPMNLWFPVSMVPGIGETISCRLDLIKGEVQDSQYLEIPVVEVIEPGEGIINYFYAEPDVGHYGDTVTLYWETENMASCVIDPYPGETGLVWMVDLSGSREITLRNDAYELITHPYAGSPLHAYVNFLGFEEPPDETFTLDWISVLIIGIAGVAVVVVSKKVNI